MRYLSRLFLQVILMMLVAAFVESGCSGQIPFGEPESAQDVSDIVPPISVDEGSAPAPEESDPSTPPVGETAKGGAIIAGCIGVRLQNPQQQYTDAANLLIIPGRSVLEQCDDTPVAGVSLPGVMTMQAQKNEWLGEHVAIPLDERRILVNDLDSKTLQTVYRLYDYDGTTLSPGVELDVSGAYTPDAGFNLTALEDINGDGLEDFIVITADDKPSDSIYYIEIFAGNDQGIDATPKKVIKVDDHSIKRPLWLAVSTDGVIAVAYPFNDIALRVAVFDVKTMQSKGFANFRLPKEGSCGLSIVKLPAKGDALAVCLSEDDYQVGKIYLKYLSDLAAVPSPLPPKVLMSPAMIFHPAPMRLKTMGGDLFVLSPGRVAGFTPKAIEAMSSAVDPWDKAAISFGLEVEDYPVDILPADYNDDEAVETLIPIRSKRDTATSPAKVFQKIFMESGEPPCRVLEFDSCHHPETG